MIEPWQTDEQLEQEARTIGYFHSLRKGSSTRAQRQAAWAAAENIQDLRRRRYRRARPLTESTEWVAFEEDTRGWTNGGLRSLSHDEVHHYFGYKAIILAPYAGRGRRFICEISPTGGRRLALSVKQTGHSLGSCAVWLPELQLWRVYSRGVSSRPHKEPDMTVEVRVAGSNGVEP